MVNGLGKTPKEELYWVYRKANQILKKNKISVFQPYIGEFATSLEMVGMSITPLRLDDEFKKILEKSCQNSFLWAARDNVNKRSICMDSFYTDDIKKIFTKVKDNIVDMEDYLFDLDSKMGDGDLGLTMKNWFIKVDEEVKKSNKEDIDKMFIKAGITLVSVAPSTMGTLVATGLIRAGKEVEGNTVVRLSDFSLIFSAFVKGIIERCKSKPGEKTIIDSILPAADALKKANEDGKDLVQAFNLAYVAAQEGLESTKNMTSVHGKAVYHSERSKGTEGPGAAAGVLLLKRFVVYLNILNLDKWSNTFVIFKLSFET